MKKFILLPIFLCFLFFACSDGSYNNSKVQESSSKKTIKEVLSGAEIYKMYCVACHGMDGTLAFSGAKNLQESVLSLEDRIDQITNGKGAMSPFKDIISEEEIRKVSIYIEELRK